MGRRSGRALGIFPSDARDIRTADTDIGQFTVAETGQVAQAGVVCPPLAQESDEIGEKHGGILSKLAEVSRNRLCFGFESLKFKIRGVGALQKDLCCDAALQN